MTEFRVKIEVAHILPPQLEMSEALFPNLSYAVQRMAQAAQNIWQGYASGKEIPPGGKPLHTRTGTYLRSIQLEQEGAFAWAVYSDAPYADAIENGAGEFDMHRWLDTSHKTRISSKGKRYLIIPFRWNTPDHDATTPNVMPGHIHGLWSMGLMASHVTDQRMYTVGHSLDGRPLTVTRRKYIWGDRLSARLIAATGATGAKARNMRGMVNMRVPGARGGAAHSQYLTFRVLSEGSSGWIIPPRPGYHLAQHTSERIRSLSAQAFGKAVETDIMTWVEQGAGQ